MLLAMKFSWICKHSQNVLDYYGGQNNYFKNKFLLVPPKLHNQ